MKKKTRWTRKHSSFIRTLGGKKGRHTRRPVHRLHRNRPGQDCPQRLPSYGTARSMQMQKLFRLRKQWPGRWGICFADSIDDASRKAQSRGVVLECEVTLGRASCTSEALEEGSCSRVFRVKGFRRCPLSCGRCACACVFMMRVRPRKDNKTKNRSECFSAGMRW
jgi:hypothetical protein